MLTELHIFKKCLCLVRLYESQAGIKIAGRNINNLIYADDIIFRKKVRN